MRTITVDELRDRCDAVLDAVAAGERFVIVRDGVPIAELVPSGKRVFAPTAELLADAARLPPIDAERFRRDVDAIIDPSVDPDA